MPQSRKKYLLVLLLLWLAITAAARTSPPPSPVFRKTQNSDEWVRRTLHVQRRYRRVLLVDGAAGHTKSIEVKLLELNERKDKGPRVAVFYPVDEVYKTLQEAADAARGGDLVAVMPGTYAGFVMGDKPDAGDGRYIHFKALGKPGDCIINRASERDPDWMILLQAAHHVIVEGFNIAGATGPGMKPAGPRAGIMLDGDFGRSGKQAHHIVIVGNFSHNHLKWGLHSTDTHTVLIQDNLFALSALEHSAYVSDGSDNYVIRRNVFFGSRASGLQCNLDSVSSFHELLKNPQLRSYPKEEPTRAWALGLVKLATEKFGANNFPDGRGLHFIIEDNVVNENGKGGAGSFNLAGLQDSLIQNNLIYGNFNHGIAQWDDANPYDASYVEPGPQSPGDVEGPADLPLWGCHSNVIRNNTVLMGNKGRAAMQSRNGSWGTVMRNNVFINDQPFSIEIFNTSIFRLDARFNVINTLSYTEMPEALKALAIALPEGPSMRVGITREKIAGEFVRYGEEPWVIIEGNWWRLNPNRPDFHPRADSRLLAHRGDRGELPARDLAGNLRHGASIGALEPSDSTKKESNLSRLSQLVEANIIATHAYQVLLAKRSGKGDPACYGSGKLSDRELEGLVEHQAKLLNSNAPAVNAWVRGENSVFDSTLDLKPILSSGLAVPANAPVNVFDEYLRRKTRAGDLRVRAIASLYQTVLEVERDGGLLQDEFAFYIALGLPVYIGQLRLPGSDADMLAAGRELAGHSCVAPFDTGAAEWQIAGRKIWNWGEKNLHIRDEKVLAAELLNEQDVRVLRPRLRALPPQRIAVIGHSFTMGLHWSSPSSFVPIVIDIFRRENPKVEFKQFAGGGLTATRAQQRFYQSVLDWKPDKVLLVVMTRTDADYEALKELGVGFAAAGIKTYMFDEIHDPESINPNTVQRALAAARAGNIEVIEVGSVLTSSPDRARFVCLDGVHMTEPYHRLMAKEWLKFLAGARGACRRCRGLVE